jgi:hypothetical protein
MVQKRLGVKKDISILLGPLISMLCIVKDGSRHLERKSDAGFRVTSDSSLYSPSSSLVCGRTWSSTLNVSDLNNEQEKQSRTHKNLVSGYENVHR